MSENESWLNFTRQLTLIEKLFTDGDFISANKETIRLQAFTAMLARRQEAKKGEKKRDEK